MTSKYILILFFKIHTCVATEQMCGNLRVGLHEYATCSGNGRYIYSVSLLLRTILANH